MIGISTLCIWSPKLWASPICPKSRSRSTPGSFFFTEEFSIQFHLDWENEFPFLIPFEILIRLLFSNICWQRRWKDYTHTDMLTHRHIHTHSVTLTHTHTDTHIHSHLSTKLHTHTHFQSQTLSIALSIGRAKGFKTCGAQNFSWHQTWVSTFDVTGVAWREGRVAPPNFTLRHASVHTQTHTFKQKYSKLSMQT